MSTDNTTVLISGGGVAGPALAYWLHRYGYTPIVVERAAQLRAGGHRIEMAGDGVDALSRLGVQQQVRAAGGPPPTGGAFYFGGSDRPVPLPDPNALTPPERAGLAIKRGSLGRILYEHVRNDVEYIFDDSITEIRQNGDGVDVTFERGASRRVDLVIGADGLNSNVRSLAFGPRKHFTRFLGTNLVIFTVDNHRGLRDTVRFHILPYRGCAVSCFPGNTELEGLFLIRSQRPLETRDLSANEKQRLVERVFAPAARGNQEVRELLHALRDSRDFHVAPSTQVSMDTWAKGRVALLGDAAYCPDPMSGQGSSLALVGAHILAGELKAAHGDHTVAYPAYEKAMRTTVTPNQRIAQYVTSFASPRTGHAGLWAREGTARATISMLRMGERFGLNLWRDTEGHVVLRDYETPERGRS